jgi:hypothetical protein
MGDWARQTTAWLAVTMISKQLLLRMHVAGSAYLDPG